MLAMDQGVVDEWLSEFKVRVRVLPSTDISERANSSSVSAIDVCVADPS